MFNSRAQNSRNSVDTSSAKSAAHISLANWGLRVTSRSRGMNGRKGGRQLVVCRDLAPLRHHHQPHQNTNADAGVGWRGTGPQPSWGNIAVTRVTHLQPGTGDCDHCDQSQHWGREIGVRTWKSCWARQAAAILAWHHCSLLHASKYRYRTRLEIEIDNGLLAGVVLVGLEAARDWVSPPAVRTKPATARWPGPGSAGRNQDAGVPTLYTVITSASCL